MNVLTTFVIVVLKILAGSLKARVRNVISEVGGVKLFSERRDNGTILNQRVKRLVRA